MSDPAVEAAKRTLDRWTKDGWNASRDFVAVDAAQQALAPLRKLEVPQNIRVVAEMLSKLKMDTPTDQKITDDYVTMLHNMADNVERHIYSTEEL